MIRRAPRQPLAFALALIALVATACTPSDTPGASDPGEPAPAYDALNLAGEPTSLEALRGKVVLLNIWATWCHPCRAEIPELERLHDEYSSAGLRVVGVSVDAGGEEERIKAFAESFGVTYDVWHDADDRISTLYRAIGVPATYLIDRSGRIRWRRLGPIAANDTSLASAMKAALAARESSQ
jgi:cytochrome c-type biogenesis protein